MYILTVYKKKNVQNLNCLTLYTLQASIAFIFDKLDCLLNMLNNMYQKVIIKCQFSLNTAFNHFLMYELHAS